MNDDEILVVEIDATQKHREELYYDESTLFKVRDALRTQPGIDRRKAFDLITAMHNAGIVFRERVK